MSPETILTSMPIALFDFLGGGELLVIFLLVLVFFGGEKMPEVARGLAKAIRELRKATSGVEQEFRKVLEEEPSKPSHSPAPPGTTPTIMPPSAPVDVSPGKSTYDDEEGIIHEDQYAPVSPAPQPTASAPVPPASGLPAPDKPTTPSASESKPDASGDGRK